MNISLAGRRALVTGANSGIGQAIALALADAGADVVVNYVTHPEAADAVVAQIAGKGRRALALRADVSNEADVDAMFARMDAQWGGIDILVNCAGIDGVRALALGPGAIQTPINQPVWSDPAALADLLTKIPLGRMGRTDEIASMAVVLCSDAASYLTGTTVMVDGAMTDYPEFARGG